MTVSREEVLAIRDRLKADPYLSPADVVRGMRTEVHALLQIEMPPPFPLPEAAKGKSDADFLARLGGARSDAEAKAIHDEHVTHYAERVAAMQASVPVEVHVAYQRERSKWPGIRDAHHFAQAKHQSELWKQADALVASVTEGAAS